MHLKLYIQSLYTTIFLYNNPTPFFVVCVGGGGRLHLFICIQTHLTLNIEYLPTHQYMVDELSCYSEKHLQHV